MLIQSLKTHFSARRMEWVGAGLMTTWGYYVVTHPQLFTANETAHIFEGLGSVSAFFGQPPEAIGVMALMIGLFRLFALFVNGSYEKTPLIRLLTAFLSVYIWVSVSIGFWTNQLSNPATIIYPWLAVMDIVSGWSAGYDLVIAEHNARRVRSHNGHANASERGFLRRVRRAIFPGYQSARPGHG